MSIPITKQRNAFPGDRTVVFQAPATDVDGGEWPAGTELTPAAGAIATCVAPTETRNAPGPGARAAPVAIPQTRSARGGT